MTTLTFFKFRIIPFLLSLLCSVSLGHCEVKELYFFGGGGEPKGPTTIFDGHINVLSKFTNAKGSSWNATHSFNGGHQKTEEQLQSKLKKAKSLGSFDEKNFSQALSDLENKLESGELKSGDQLLLIMDTHGAMSSSKEKTHSVALSEGTAVDLRSLSGAKTVSMDKLEKLFTLASEKGVKLALFDLSCFSGNTLKIANKNICVISASGEKHYGYSEERDSNDNSSYRTFGGRLLERMKSGHNLEEIFLKARSGSISSDFPMISTDTGRLVNDLIYKMITPYLNYNQASTIDFSRSYDEKNLAQALCKTENQYSEIDKRLNDISVLASIPKNLLNTSGLKRKLEAYRKYQIHYEKALSDAQKAGDEVKDIISRDYSDKAKLFEHEDGLSILTVDRESSLKLYKKMTDEATSDFSKKYYQKIYDDLLIKDAISKDASQKISADSKSNIKKFDEIFKHSYKTKELADDVSSEAKKVYDSLYRAHVNFNKSNGSNPCREFVL